MMVLKLMLLACAAGTAAAATQLTDANINDAADLWFSNRDSCISTYGHISDWEVQQVTNMEQLFRHHSDFNEDISKWDNSSVTNMRETFQYATHFNQPIGNWDISRVMNMKQMFGYTNFNQDISKWDTSSVTNMVAVFYAANAFNQPIGDWDTSNVESIGFMFSTGESETNVFNQDLSKWDTSKMTAMYAAFRFNKVFNQPTGNWDTSKVTQMHELFLGTHAFDQDLSKWDTSEVTNYNRIFDDARSMPDLYKPCFGTHCTSAPTPAPAPATPSPTPFPTPHPCDDGSHGCDKSANGICYKASGNAWTCGCKSGFYCTSGCSAPHTNHVCTIITPAPTSYPTLAPTPSPTISLDEVEGIKQCCAKNVPIDSLLPTLTCSNLRGKTDKELRTHIHGLSMTTPQILEWLKAQKCLHTFLPTQVCKRTTCSYSEIKHAGVSYWHTLVRGDKNHMEHYHCEKHIHDGDKCECLCNEEFTCTIVHHFKSDRTDGKAAPMALTQENCAPPGPTNAPTTSPTPAPTPTPTAYPTYYPTPFPTPHPCDDGSHGCYKGAHGICYKAGGNGYTCGCRGGYHCTRGCAAPHSYHTCTLITAAPTNYPTPFPTPHPTPHSTFRADWWSGRCTACPARWYDHGWSCHGGYTVAERGCGFLGCESRCRTHGH